MKQITYEKINMLMQDKFTEICKYKPSMDYNDSPCVFQCLPHIQHHQWLY